MSWDSLSLGPWLLETLRNEKKVIRRNRENTNDSLLGIIGAGVGGGGFSERKTVFLPSSAPISKDVGWDGGLRIQEVEKSVHDVFEESMEWEMGDVNVLSVDRERRFIIDFEKSVRRRMEVLGEIEVI